MEKAFWFAIFGAIMAFACLVSIECDFAITKQRITTIEQRLDNAKIPQATQDKAKQSEDKCQAQ